MLKSGEFLLIFLHFWLLKPGKKTSWSCGLMGNFESGSWVESIDGCKGNRDWTVEQLLMDLWCPKFAKGEEYCENTTENFQQLQQQMHNSFSFGQDPNWIAKDYDSLKSVNASMYTNHMN